MKEPDQLQIPPGTARQPRRCQACWRTCVPGTLRPTSTPQRAAIRRCSHARNVTDLWPGTVCERSPRWWNEIPDSIQLMGCVTGSSHDGSVRASLQLSNELTCHIWVPIVNHRETVRPTCPRRLALSNGQRFGGQSLQK